MTLTRENYFSPENEMKYFGSTQLKDFLNCEAAALAKIRGEYVPEKSTALLVGSYVDAHFEGTFDLFCAQHPEILKKDGSLKSDYAQANDIIGRIEQDEMLMKYMAGEKQVIMTANLFGYDFKIRIDSYHPGKAIVDLKIMRDFEPVYKEGLGRVNFALAWGYDLQGTIYQAVVHMLTGERLPFILACATKQKDGADIGLFSLPQHELDSAFKIVEHYIDRFADIKSGIVEPKRCEKCAYCRQTKVLTGIDMLEVSTDE